MLPRREETALRMYSLPPPQRQDGVRGSLSPPSDPRLALAVRQKLSNTQVKHSAS